MLAISRRSLIRSAVLGGVLAAGPRGVRVGFANAASPGPVLVFLLLRGGMDGLNLVAPSDDADLFAARPESLRLVASGTNAALPLANGPSSNDWRLHPKATALKKLYDAKELAFIHATGLPADSRSHFQMQAFLEHGVVDQLTLGQTGTGWIARLGTAGGYANQTFGLVSADSTLPPSMSGDSSAISMPNMSQFNVGSTARTTFLNTAYANASGMIGTRGRAALTAVTSFSQLYAKYTAPAAGTYGTDGLSAGLAIIAGLIKMNSGLRVAEVEFNDWDTHINQQSRFATSVTTLNAGLGSFLADMTASGKAVTVVAMSEFGRRVKSNASGGTDHGHGNVMIVAGDGVKGGRIYGKWMGLSSSALNLGDVPVTTDFRSVLTEIVANRLGISSSTLFPGFTVPPQLGLFGS